MSSLKKFVVFLLVLIILIPVSVFSYLYYKLNSVYDKGEESNTVVTETNFKKHQGIKNILLVGVDTSNKESVSRSDAMMILTIDSNKKILKLTSLARDTYVKIPGHGEEKLTHAYAYGGINLLLETVENNFELDIQDYVVVDFKSFMSLLDVIGGISIDVKNSELKELNYFITETYYLGNYDKRGSIKYINSSGTQTLNAYQTLAYARIRKNDSAFGRDERQRSILQATLNKVSSLSISKYPELLDSILPYVKTDMSPSNILSLGAKILSMGNLNIEQLEFPILDYSKQGIYGNAGWVIRFDKDKCLPILHNFIFNDSE